jgi:serine/threonine-protein kinase
MTPAVEDHLRWILRDGAPPEELPPEAEAWASDPTRQILDHVLVEPLGEGGSACVWKSWDRALGRWVAVKIPNVTPEPRDAERFLREARAVAKLSHPNIAPVIRVGQVAGRPFIVLPYVQGRSLAGRKLPLREAVAILRTAAGAIQHAHGRGVVHRDLKPANILLDEEGRVWLVDFGLAYLVDGSDKPTTRGVVFGTPHYMSPEQAAGNYKSRDPATDIYGLGATLYELLAGVPPFAGVEASRILRLVLHEPPVRLRKINPRIPKELETIVLKAMEKDSRHRYRTAGEMAEDLGRWLSGVPIVGRRRIAGLRRTGLALGALGVLVSSAAATFLVGSSKIEMERSRAAAAEETAREHLREVARVTLDAALKVRRAGDFQGMKQFLPKLEWAYSRVPGDAEVEYVMGRAFRGMMETERAWVHIRRALKHDPQHAGAIYEKLLLESMALARNHLAANARGEEPSQESLASHTRSIEEGCARLCAAGILDQAQLLAASGILDFVRARFESAVLSLESAVRKDPFLEEAWWFLGKTFHRMSVGDRRDYFRARAEKCWREATARDRGYFPHWWGLANLLVETGGNGILEGAGKGEELADAEKCAGEVLRLIPDHAPARAMRGGIRVNLAVVLGARNSQEFESMACRAEEDLLEAVRLDPGLFNAWVHLGNLSGILASRAKDPVPELSEGARRMAQALRCNPRSCEALWRTGFFYLRLGERAGSMDHLRRALDSFDRAISIDSSSSRAWLWRGRAYEAMGRLRHERGLDPDSHYVSAEWDYSQAIALAKEPADLGHGYLFRGRLFSRRAESLGRPEGFEWALASEDLRRALERLPGQALSIRRDLERTRAGGSR